WPARTPDRQAQVAEPAERLLARRVSRSDERQRRRPPGTRGQGSEVLRVTPEGQVVGSGTGGTVAFETRAVVGEKAVVRRPESERRLQQVGVVRKPVGPAGAETGLDIAHVLRREAGDLEDQHNVDRRAAQSRGEPAG